MIHAFHKKLYLGFLNMHILHHASQEPIYGLWMIEELNHHGYEVGASHIYPLLKSLTDEGYLLMEPKQTEGRIRKYYRITTQGLHLLEELKHKLKELIAEVYEDEHV